MLLASVILLYGCVQPEIKNVKAEWGEINDQYTELVVNIDISNPLPFLPLKDVESYVYVNGIQIAKGNAKEIQKDRLILSIKIENERIKDMWISHLQHGERSEMLIKVVPVINLLITEYRYPIEMKNEFVTGIFGTTFPDQNLNIFGKEVFSIKNIELKVGKVDNQKTEINLEGLVVNNAPVKLTVKKVEYSILMNDVKVATGSEYLNLNLPPGKKESVSIPIYMDNSKLPGWWVSHVRNGEHSTVKVNLKLYIEFMGDEYPLALSYDTEIDTSLAGSVKI